MPPTLPPDRALLELVSRGAIVVPPYPAVAVRLQKVVAANDFGLADVASIVSSDPILTADVLRCANSARFRRGPVTTNLGQAIALVGARDVTRLALSSGLASHALAPGPLSALKRRTWIESVAAAVLCEELARLRGLRSPEAFVLGLLHDFGKVVAIATLEPTLKNDRGERQPIEFWSELVDRHHVTLGAAMAARWNLPGLVSEIIALHHQGHANCQDAGLLEVVQTSDQVVALLGRQPEVSSAHLASVRALRGPGELQALARIIEGIPEFVAAFEPQETGRDVPSVVEQPATALAPGQRRVNFGVLVNLAHKPRRYTAAAIATNGLLMFGKEHLPENHLVEATLECQPRPFKHWVTTKVSRAEGDAVRVEVQPFALSGEVRSLWNLAYARALTA